MSIITIAIHKDPNAPTPYPDRWAEFVAKAGARVKWVNLRLPDAIEQVRGCDGVMWHWEFMPHERQVGYRILHTIEQYLKMPVFPNHRTAWHYDDKIAQYYIFQAMGIPTPKTWIFWDHEPAREWAKSTTYPKVFKLSTGASSFAVRIVETPDQVLSLIDLMFGPGAYPDTLHNVPPASQFFPRNRQQLQDVLHRWKRVVRWAVKDQLPDLPPRFWWQPEKNYVYFQEFLPNNDFDTRITVIGDRAFGFRRFNRPGDFRASGSGRIDHDPDQINLECVDLALNVSKMLGVQSMAYDMLRDVRGNVVIGEMSYTYLDWVVEKCPGHWLKDGKWLSGHIWPEKAQVDDFLGMISGILAGQSKQLI